MDIYIITDGNKKIGLGHIYQSKTFAHYITESEVIRMGGGLSS